MKFLQLGTEKSAWNQHYIDLNTIPGARIKNFIIGSGLSFANNLYNTLRIRQSGEIQRRDYKLYSRFDLGLIVNSGYELAFQRIKLLFELRYTKYFRHNARGEFPESHSRGNILSFGVGVVFRSTRNPT